MDELKNFNITIGNVTANTSMIEEDVLRMRMGLKPQIYGLGEDCEYEILEVKESE